MAGLNEYYTLGIPVDTTNNPINTRTGSQLSTDAWGRPKAVSDLSLLHGMFTNGIQASKFKEVFNSVEQTSYTNCTTTGGLLSVTGGGFLNDETVLDTFRSVRYEPNRGHLYSSSIILPDPTALAERDFGMFTEENGVFFRLKSDGNLYACRRTTVGSTTTTEELIDLSGLTGFDVSKGNIYDIQMQWRGVGNICFYIGNPESGSSELVHEMPLLGTLTELSISNPALPIAFRSQNLGADVPVQCGCVDISSEGGKDENHTYGSISIDNEEGQVAIPGASSFNTPVLVVRNKTSINLLRNVRDMHAFYVSAYADQRCLLRVWVTRDETALTLNDSVWRDHDDGFVEIIQYDNPNVTTPLTFDTNKAQLVFGSRVNIDNTFVSTALFGGKAEIHQTPGDIFIFTMHRENGGTANVGVSYEFGTEV